jgi:seryl-tRNA synthetase
MSTKLTRELEALQTERTTLAKSIGLAKERGEDIQPILARLKDLTEVMQTKEEEWDESLERWANPHYTDGDIPLETQQSRVLWGIFGITVALILGTSLL